MSRFHRICHFSAFGTLITLDFIKVWVQLPVFRIFYKVCSCVCVYVEGRGAKGRVFYLWETKYFLNGVYSYRKEFALTGAISFFKTLRIDTIEGRQKKKKKKKKKH